MNDTHVTRSVEFRMFRPGAAEVFLAGDFSGWKPLPMTSGNGGYWKCCVPLPEGVYRFKYLVRSSGGTAPDRSPFGLEWMPRGLSAVVLVSAGMIEGTENASHAEVVSPPFVDRQSPGGNCLTWEESDLLDCFRKLPGPESREALLGALRDYTCCV